MAENLKIRNIECILPRNIIELVVARVGNLQITGHIFDNHLFWGTRQFRTMEKPGSYVPLLKVRRAKPKVEWSGIWGDDDDDDEVDDEVDDA